MAMSLVGGRVLAPAGGAQAGLWVGGPSLGRAGRLARPGDTLPGPIPAGLGRSCSIRWDTAQRPRLGPGLGVGGAGGLGPEHTLN